LGITPIRLIQEIRNFNSHPFGRAHRYDKVKRIVWVVTSS
jgi:hypothetical protein